MRTFIALDLSDSMKKELTRLQEELKKAGSDVKWVNPLNIHLTLKFLGNVEESKIDEIKAILDGISQKNNAYELSLFNLGSFPSLNQLRVLWAGIDKGCSETEKIAEEIENGLEKIGFPKETRPFSAHLTIGRVRSGKNKAKLKEIITSLQVNPETCQIKSVTLYQSKLTPKGPIYTPLHVANLTGA